MISLSVIFVLAQSATLPSETGTSESIAAAASAYHFAWQSWLTYYHLNYVLAGTATLFLILTWILTGIFRGILERFHLSRTIRVATLAIATYLMLWAWNPKLMNDEYDYGSLFVHKAFVATMLLVTLRLLDWLVVVPLLTRGGRLPVPRFVHQVVWIILYIFAALGYCSWAFNLNIDKFLAGSAVLSIVLGLALQETLGNFFSGMVMQASSPFQLGDWIDCGGTEGRVVDMTWRAVTLQTNEDNNILIPNSVVAKAKIINYHAPTRATLRKVTVGVDYSVPPNDAKRVLLEAAREASGVLADPPPFAGLANFGDSALEYVVGFWIDRPQTHGAVEQQVRVNIWYRLKMAGYNIPFPTRTVEMLSTDNQPLQEQQRLDRLRILGNTPLFSMLTPEQHAQIAAQCKDFRLAAEQNIYRQGDAGASVFIVCEGKVASAVLAEDGSAVAIDTIESGDFFGEYSVMTDRPRPTTMKAVTDIRCLEITREELRPLIASDPNLMREVSALVAKRSAARAERLAAAGADLKAQGDQDHANSQHGILETMKHLFDKFHLPPVLPKIHD